MYIYLLVKNMNILDLHSCQYLLFNTTKKCENQSTSSFIYLY